MPNVLLITTDQQRYDSLGFTGNEIVRTPNLDALAGQSTSFTRAYTPCPLCCPARQTLLSGVMPSVHGGLWNYDNTSPVPALEPGAFTTWPEIMQEGGWTSAYLGKWHVNPRHDATAFGYESYEREAGVPQEMRQQYFPVDAKKLKERPVGRWPIGMIDGRPLEQTPTHDLAGRAIARLEELTTSGKPWHLRVDFSEPHLPCIPHERFAELYDPASIPEWPNFRDELGDKPRIQRTQLSNWGIEDWSWEEWAVYLACYYGVISQYDDAIGRVLAALDESGQRDDTIVIYTTDHGDAAGSHRMMDKHYVMYEEEVRVPLLVCMPGSETPAGETSDAWVSHYLDLGPTILEACGLPPMPQTQGVSLVGELDGTTDRRRDQIFSEYNGQQFGLYTQRMIRDEQYKLVWNPTDVDELYDLKNDPWEMDNLATRPEHDDLRREYRRRLYSEFETLDDQMVKGLWMRYALHA